MEHISQSEFLNLKPRLKRYLSITSYLQDYYSYRKRLAPDFSYENWALELHFKSRSSLRMMAYGKRSISEKLIESFGIKEIFSNQEQQYIVLLSKLQNTKNLSLKKIYLDKISELTEFDYKKTEIKNVYDFLSSPEMHVIQMLVSFTDFKATTKSIKSVLNLGLDRINIALSKLQNMGLIEAISTEGSADIVWKSKAKFFNVAGSEDRSAINEFHVRSLKEAEKIVHQDILDKKIKSLFFSLGETDYAEFIETVEEFTNKLKVKYANDYIQNKKIYKLNLQAYPVTEKIEKE